MKPHPIAELFPLMSDKEIAFLAEDIEKNGLLNPGSTYEGKILDGRNREAACRIAKCEFKTKEYRGKDALGFVIAQNDIRRHLTTGQRAQIAARISTFKHGGDRRSKDQGPKMDLEKAAHKLGVSRNSVQQAAFVEESAIQKVKDAVATGELPVTVAAEIATMNKQQQHETMNDGVEEARKKTKKFKADKKKADAGFNPDAFIGISEAWSKVADLLIGNAHKLPEDGRMRKDPTEYVLERLRSTRTLISQAIKRIEQ